VEKVIVLGKMFLKALQKKIVTLICWLFLFFSSDDAFNATLILMFTKKLALPLKASSAEDASYIKS
jgi:hypothetical protein